ncbi:MAG: STAS domain-containing protein [Chromatiales bacterium]|nr:STAS domain-containing protein [Chromatiales bacterium]
MSEKAASAYVNEFEGHLVGSVQVELTESVLDNFREHLLEAVQRTRPMGVIIDVSAVPFMDVQEFAQLRRILNMTALMGGRPILVGLQPGIVAALVEMDADVEGLETAISVEQAVRRLRVHEKEEAVPELEDTEDEEDMADANDAEQPQQVEQPEGQKDA